VPTRLFDLGVEANLPTWWASAQLWTAAALLASVAWRTGAHPASFALAALIAAFSVDEVASLHERIAFATRSELLPVTGVWPFVLGPLALVAVGVSARMARRTWHRDPTAAAWLGIGLVGLLVSAAGIELLVNVVPWRSGAHFIQVLAEESGELVSGTLILAGAYRLAIPPSSMVDAADPVADG